MTHKCTVADSRSILLTTRAGSGKYNDSTPQIALSLLAFGSFAFRIPGMADRLCVLVRQCI